MDTLRQLRQLGPVVVRYFVGITLVGFAVDGGVYSVLLNLYLVRLGFGPEQIGLVNSTGTLAFALWSLPAGTLGQRFGSRLMLLIGLGGLLIGTFTLPLAGLLPVAWRLTWLIVTLVIAYSGLSLYFVNTAPYLMSLVDQTQRNRMFSIQTALLSFAAFVGSLIGGLLPPVFAALIGASLLDAAPFGVALGVAGLAITPAILALRRGPDTHAAAVEQPMDPASLPAASAVVAPIVGLLVLIACVRVLQVTGTAVANTFFNVYLDAELLLPSAQIGAIIAVARLLGVPAALATTALTARYGNRAVVIGASLGTAVSLLPLALVPHWSAAGLGFIGVVGLSWIRYAASIVFFMELVPPNRRATVSGVTEMAAGLCFTILTFGGGYIIAAVGYQSLFLLGAGITALSAGIFWLCFRDVRR